MQLFTDIRLANGRYSAQITSTRWTEQQRIALDSFGEPVIDIGGTFTGSVARPGQSNTIVTFTPVSGGSEAAATPIISNGAVTSFTINSGGYNYATAPTITIAAPPAGGVQAVASATVGGGAITALTIANGGSGYGAPPQVIISGGGGSGATIFANLSNGVITGLTISAGGTGYGAAPTISFSGNGSGAVLTATLSGGAVVGYSIASGGSGYNVVPAPVSFTLPSKLRRIRSDFPVRQVFDTADSFNADINCELWATTIKGLVITAVANLLQEDDPFVGQSMTTV